VIDHAGNVQRHGRIEDFVPPELSEVDKNSDRKKKTDTQADYYPCGECRALMAPNQRVCDECGHERTRKPEVINIAGELREEHAEVERRSPRAQMLDLYLQLRRIAKQRGYKRGWAYTMLLEKYDLKAPYAWLEFPTREPTPKTLRLVKSWNIAYWKATQSRGRGRSQFGHRSRRKKLSDVRSPHEPLLVE
jgi:hypothetical protein